MLDRLVTMFLLLLAGLCAGLWLSTVHGEFDNDDSDTAVGCTDECLEPADDEKPYTPLMHPHTVTHSDPRWI